MNFTAFEQVPDHLLQPVGVAVDADGHRIADDLQLDPLSFGRGAHRFHRGGNDRDQIDRLDLEPQLSADDPRDVQQILNQLRLDPGVALDDFDRPRDQRAVEALVFSSVAHPMMAFIGVRNS